MRLIATLLLFLACLVSTGQARAALDLSRATIIANPGSGPEQAAVTLLVEEVAKRTGLNWPVSTTDTGAAGTHIHIRRTGIGAGEGFQIETEMIMGHPSLIIKGNDARGVLYGIGHLLRQLETAPGRATLSAPINIIAKPEQPVRSHQIGYRFKNNTYDAWTLAQFEQEIRDLAVFGANAVQLIAPVSDDAANSPLFPAPPLPTILGIAHIAAKYGLDADLYYPVIRADYGDPAQVAAELSDFDALVAQFPALHRLYVPGGDPGHTPPDRLFPLLEQMARILRRHHPAAELWVSTQGFDRAGYAAFYRQLDRQPPWLTGIFIGPQSRDPMPVQRRRIPARYPIQAYPDIGHTLHAQFPVADWDPALALTEGREPVSPRPQDQTAIFQHLKPHFSGFVTYSEGVTDDVNKMLWTRLGWSAATRAEDTLLNYARYFLSPGDPGRLAALILALEQNWRGPVQTNQRIPGTLRGFTQAAPDIPTGNWRLNSLLYRAHYDAYVQRRAVAEASREQAALDHLRDAARRGSMAAMAQARAALSGVDDAQTQALRTRLFDLAQALRTQIGLQLSVPLFGASGWERGANLDRVDTSLNNRVWLTQQFDKIATLPDEGARQQALAAIVNWESPVPGTLYDDLGDPTRSKHLVRGQGVADDPQLFATSIHSIADVTPDRGWRMSQVTYAETLYDQKLTLRYGNLDRTRSYRVRITYAGEDYALPIRLMADGSTQIHPPLLRPSNPAILEFPIPQALTRDGTLRLDWTRPPGMGGSGRGKQVAEVWLIPDVTAAPAAIPSGPAAPSADR